MEGQNLPDYLHPEGDYRHIFSYHPMDVQIARAEGVYIYDDKDNRYFDASGGPFAVNLPHNHPSYESRYYEPTRKIRLHTSSVIRSSASEVLCQAC